LEGLLAFILNKEGQESGSVRVFFGVRVVEGWSGEERRGEELVSSWWSLSVV
jgi:hypothetical protein